MTTPLERHCGWLLRAYPRWYRRERAGEMLDTLLAASLPGRNWPSFRDARALVLGGLRVRGPAWCLSVLWAALGAAGAGYDFIVSAHVPAAIWRGIPLWAGEPGAIAYPADLGALAWVLLTLPVLVAGLVRLRRSRLQASEPARTAVGIVWAGTWSLGIALMYPIANWHPASPPVLTCSKGSGCALAGYRYAVVSWGELALFAAWLAVGAAMTLVLAWTARQRARCAPAGTVLGA